MEKGPEDEFQAALSDMEASLRNGIKAFAEWMASEWKMTREQWTKEFVEPPPEGDYFDGYNAGVESVKSACEFFLDEYAGQ